MMEPSERASQCVGIPSQRILVLFSLAVRAYIRESKNSFLAIDRGPSLDFAEINHM